jgi:arylsulfatase A-like enzyme
MHSDDRRWLSDEGHDRSVSTKQRLNIRRHTAIGLAIIIAAAALFWLIIILSNPPADRPNVLWITMDSCRPDHLGCYGYTRAHTPHIDAIAAQGWVFTQAIAQASATRYSVPSMATGRYPLRVPSRTFAFRPPDAHPTLAEILEKSGYGSCVISDEHPVVRCAKGFQQILRISKDTAERTHACLKIIDQLKEEPFFIWLYYWDPHTPYAPPERFRTLFEPTPLQQPHPPEQRITIPGQRRIPIRDRNGMLQSDLVVMKRINFLRDVVPTELDRQHLINLYDAEIAHVDEQIGLVIEKLTSEHLWDNTMVLITADHGEAFGEHQRYYHGLSLFDEVIHVPLIIKPPGLAVDGRNIAAPVRNVDIMPTVVDVCGASIPRGLDGISLQPFVGDRNWPGCPAYSEIYYQERGFQEHLLISFRTAEYKLITDLVQATTELYDLGSDPRERHDLLQPTTGGAKVPSAEQREQNLRKALLAHLDLEDLTVLADRKLTRQMDEETREQLRSLGYIE